MARDPNHRLLAIAALCAFASSAVFAGPRWPQDFPTRVALAQAMKQHPPGEREIGAPLYPGAFFDAACSAAYSWERRSWNIVGWCFRTQANGQVLKGFINGAGRPYGPSATITGDGLLYQIDPKREAFFGSFTEFEPDASELKVRRHPDAHYDRACSAQRSYDLVLHARQDQWQRAWCFVADASLVDLRRFFKFGELGDQRAGALVSLTQVLDEPPRTEIEYLIPAR